MSDSINRPYTHDPDPQGSASTVGNDNLHALAGAIDLPPAPNDEQLARWKSAGAAPASIPIHIRPRRRFRVLAAGSALAASVAVAAVLFVHGGHGSGGSEVQAATIIQSLRSAVINGVNLTVRGLVAEGLTVNGDVRVRFAKPVRVEAILDDAQALHRGEPGAGGDGPEIAALHGAFDIRAGDDGMFEGLDVHVEGASAPGSTWAFVKSNNPNRIAEAPLARRIMGMAANGVMIDLGDRGFGSLHAARQHDARPKADQPEPEKMTLSVGVNERNGLEVSLSHMHHLMHHIAASVHGEHHARRAPQERPALTDEQRQAHRADIRRHDELLRSILSGRAGEAELVEMLNLLHRYAGESAVEQQADGSYLLKVLMDPGHGGEKDAGMLVRVSYARERGVQWAEYFWTGEQEGGRGGAVRLDFAEDPIEARLLDKQRVIEPGKTTIVTPELVRGLLGIE